MAGEHEDADRKHHYISVEDEAARLRSWHVDRTIPLVLIFTIFVQTAGAFWWASSQTAINNAQDDKIVALTTTLTRLADNLADRNERLARMEAIGEATNNKIETLGQLISKKFQ